MSFSFINTTRLEREVNVTPQAFTCNLCYPQFFHLPLSSPPSTSISCCRYSVRSSSIPIASFISIACSLHASRPLGHQTSSNPHFSLCRRVVRRRCVIAPSSLALSSTRASLVFVPAALVRLTAMLLIQRALLIPIMLNPNPVSIFSSALGLRLITDRH